MCGINLISTSDWKLPDLFKYRYWVALIVTLTSPLSGLFLVPVKAGFLEVTQDDVNGGCIISISLICSALNVFIYVLLIASILSILASLHNVVTRLKWEPASIASQLAILYMFDFEDAFTGAEFIPGSHIRKNIRRCTHKFGILRFGYWRNVKTGKIIHGLRSMKWEKREYWQTVYNRLLHMTDPHLSSPTQPLDYSKMILFVKDTIVSKKPLQPTYSADGMCSSRGTNMSNVSNLRYTEAPLSFFNKQILANSELSKLAWIPLPLTDWWLLLLETVGVLSVIACIISLSIGLTDRVIKLPDSAQLALSFVHKTVHSGEVIKVSSVYNVLLTILYNVFSLTFINADIQIRSMESLHELNTPQSSDRSVLLDYVSPDPITMFIASLKSHHWRVAWHTFVACTCQISPIPAGHIFTRGRQGLTRATMVNPLNIFISLGIVVAYCICITVCPPPIRLQVASASAHDSRSGATLLRQRATTFTGIRSPAQNGQGRAS
jgi:hypothetical protein